MRICSSSIYKTKEICIRVVNTCSFVFKSVPNQYKTQEMCDKAVDDYSIALEFVLGRYKSKKMCDKIISENPFMLKYCPDKYITQKMCDEAADDFLPTINFVPDWFVTIKMIKKLFTALHADKNILYFDQDSANVVSNCNEMGILDIDLKNFNLDNDFDEDDPGTIIHVELLAWHIKFEKCKALKKELNEELVPVGYHPNRWWDTHTPMSEDEKKEIDPMFIDEL